jgi:hypothetical protein
MVGVIGYNEWEAEAKKTDIYKGGKDKTGKDVAKQVKKDKDAYKKNPAKRA